MPTLSYENEVVKDQPIPGYENPIEPSDTQIILPQPIPNDASGNAQFITVPKIVGRTLRPDVSTDATVITYASGFVTRAGDAASGTQNIAHGLATIPRYIKLTGFKYIDGNNQEESVGSYNGLTNNCYFLMRSDTAVDVVTTSVLYSIVLTDTAGNPTSTSQRATATLDITNIVLTWVKANAPNAATMTVFWEAFA